MLPTQPLDNHLDRAASHAISARKLCLCRTVCGRSPYIADGSRSQLRLRDAFATSEGSGLISRIMRLTVGVTVLVDHVTNIVGGCSKEQMRRVDARRVIAAVTDHHSGRNRSMRQLVGIAMGGDFRSICRDEKPAIPSTFLAGDPNPAIPGFIDVLPEPRFGGAFPRSIGASMRAVFRLAACDIDGVLDKRRAAMSTYELSGFIGGNLGAHLKLLTSDATPWAVCNSARASLCPNFTTSRVIIA